MPILRKIKKNETFENLNSFQNFEKFKYFESVLDGRDGSLIFKKNQLPTTLPITSLLSSWHYQCQQSKL